MSDGTITSRIKALKVRKLALYEILAGLKPEKEPVDHARARAEIDLINTRIADLRMTRFEGLIFGLNTLSKYENNEVAAEHDIIYAGPTADQVSPEDASDLLEVGWHIDSDSGSWAFFT